MTSTTTLEQNPLLAGLPLRRRPEPCTIVIFGASGDLTERKLMPALYSLAFRRLLPEHFAVVGVARSEENDDGFREEMRTAVERFARDPFRREVWDELAAGMHYLQLSAMDGKSGKKLAEMLTGLDEERGTQGNRLYYFAVPPGAFEPLVGMVAGMPSGGGWNRLIVEKPFGHDLASARELNGLVTEHFTEREIFRIDIDHHALGDGVDAPAIKVHHDLRSEDIDRPIRPANCAPVPGSPAMLPLCRSSARRCQNESSAKGGPRPQGQENSPEERDRHENANQRQQPCGGTHLKHHRHSHHDDATPITRRTPKDGEEFRSQTSPSRTSGHSRESGSLLSPQRPGVSLATLLRSVAKPRRCYTSLTTTRFPSISMTCTRAPAWT